MSSSLSRKNGEREDSNPARGALRHKPGLDQRAPLVGIVGRVTGVKNHRLFLTAAARLLAVRPDVHFVVVGDGDLGPEVRTLARRLGLSSRVTFTGWRHDLSRIYADLDVLVSCSKSEGTPFAIIEAMAAGCPVVATAVGGVPDLIDDQVSGLLVPPGEPAPLAAAVLRLIRDPGFARALARSAADRVETRFGAGRLASDMDALYTELLRGYESARSTVRNPRPAAQATSPRATGVDRAGRR